MSANRTATGRVAQFLLGAPLGLLQLAAVIFFTITEPIKGGDWLIVVWGIVMSSSCAVLALFVLGSARARSIAFALLAAQACFSLVKLTVYHESASLVILGITAVTAATLFFFHQAQGASSPLLSPER